MKSGKFMDWNLGKSISESWENPLVDNVIEYQTPTDISMTLTRPGYRPRLIDVSIARTLRTTGAVCIEGPKWCGKTWSALNQANSWVDLSDAHGNFQNRRLAKTDPNLVLEGDAPHLVDEWQEVPKLWDAVRTAVDSGQKKGMFILTGSSTPVRKGILHSGTDSMATLRMHTMSLYESGDSIGTASISDMFGNRFRSSRTGDVDLRDLIYLTVRGGWPASIGVTREDASVIGRQYLASMRDEDFEKIDGVKRDADRVRMLIRSLARNESTLASKSKLASDIKEEDGWGPAENTVNDYLGILNRMFLIEDQPAFNPGLRSSYRVGKTAKRHLADPSLAAAAMGANIENLFRDLNTFGLLFEALCERDLRVYSQSLGGTIGHYRDGRGNEIDTAVQLPDGRWGAFEIKLGMNQVDKAAEDLLELTEKIRKDEGKVPEFLCVIVGLSSYAYRREDGVYVVPITALRDRRAS